MIHARRFETTPPCVLAVSPWGHAIAARVAVTSSANKRFTSLVQSLSAKHQLSGAGHRCTHQFLWHLQDCTWRQSPSSRCRWSMTCLAFVVRVALIFRRRYLQTSATSPFLLMSVKRDLSGHRCTCKVLWHLQEYTCKQIKRFRPATVDEAPLVSVCIVLSHLREDTCKQVSFSRTAYAG